MKRTNGNNRNQDISMDLELSSSSDTSSSETTGGNGKKKKRKARNGNSTVQLDKKKKMDSASIPGGSNDLGNSIIRPRLYFPKNDFDFHDKVLWSVKLSKAHRDFEVLFKEGRNVCYITVKDDVAVKFLTTKGFDKVVMEKPLESTGERTKIILFGYPTYLDPEDILVDSKFIWVKRREVKIDGELVPKPQLIALMKGPAPEKVFISCLGYRRVSVYKEPPVICYKCCKWGHMAWKCLNEQKCRFCGKKHESKICGDKIKAKENITPRCCNCGGPHNASAWICPKRPKVDFSRPEASGNEVLAATSSTTVPLHNKNVWEKRREKRLQESTRDEDMVTELAGSDFILELRNEIDELKKAVLDIKTVLQSLAPLNEPCSSNKSVNVNKKTDNVFDVGSNSNMFDNVTHVLDSVVQYMMNPRDDLKTNVLCSIKRLKGKMSCNGS